MSEIQRDIALLTQGILYPPDGDNNATDALAVNFSCTLVRAGWFPCQHDWNHPRRALPHFTALVFVAGGADYVIGEECYHPTPGNILLIPPHVIREGHHHDPVNPLHLYVVHFFARLYDVLDLSTIFQFPVSVSPREEQFTLVVQAVQRIIGELSAKEPGYGLAVKGACTHFLALLWRAAMTDFSGRAPQRATPVAELARLSPVFRMVQSRYNERLSLDELAAAVCLHPAYFSTLFKRITGLSPLRYVAHYRLERVRELLLTTDLSITEIATITGYRDPFYLSRVFHRAEGASPSEYRKAKKLQAFP